MKKRWFSVLLGTIIGISLFWGSSHCDQIQRNSNTNQNLNLPLNQIGQDGKQQTHNDNQKLFQTDQVGDLKMQRQKLEKQGRAEAFRKNRKLSDPYTQKNVFIKHVKKHQNTYDYTQQTKTKKQFHFSYWLVIGLGFLVGLGATWHMLRSEKLGQRSTDHHRATE